MIQIAISSIKHLGRRVGIRHKVAVGALERILGLLNLFRFLLPFLATIKVESQVASLLHLIYVILVGPWTLTGFARSSHVPILRDANDVLSYRLILEFSADDWSESMKFFDPGIAFGFLGDESCKASKFFGSLPEIPSFVLGHPTPVPYWIYCYNNTKPCNNVRSPHAFFRTHPSLDPPVDIMLGRKVDVVLLLAYTSSML